MEKKTKIKKERVQIGNLEDHLINMFFGFKSTGEEWEDLVSYKIMRRTARDFTRTRNPKDPIFDPKKFYWMNDESILSDQNKLRQTLKKTHNLSDGRIYKLLNNYKTDEELKDIPISHFY